MTDVTEGNGEIFLRAVFHGDRFDGGRFPLELGADLAALNRLIVDFAREIYLQQNPQRKRVPKHFATTRALTISAIQSGSAALLVQRSNNELFEDDTLESAREGILSVMAAADPPVMQTFPAHFLGRFNSIGRYLLPNERIEFSSPKEARVVTYDRQTRRRLAEQTEGVEDAFFAIGSIQALNATTKSFQIRTPDGLIDGRYKPELDTALRRAIAAGVDSGLLSDGAAPVRIDGTGTFKANQLKAFEAETVTPIEFPTGGQTYGSIAHEIRSFLDLEEGWLDGDGNSISKNAAEEILHVLAGLADEGQPAPTVWPTTEGGVRAEWRLQDSETVLEVSSAVPKFYAFQRFYVSSEVTDIELNDHLNAADVAQRVTELLGGGKET
jgi:hypothetical protein